MLIVNSLEELIYEYFDLKYKGELVIFSKDNVNWYYINCVKIENLEYFIDFDDSPVNNVYKYKKILISMEELR